MEDDRPLSIVQVVNCPVGGGAEALVKDLTTRFAKRGHQATNCYLNDSSEAARKNLRFRILNFLGFVRVGLKLALRRLRADVFHGHLFPAFYTVAFCAPTGGARVITEHNTVYTRRKFAFFRWLDGQAYGRLDAIICISDGVRNALAAMYPQHAARMITIYNGIDVQRFQLPRSMPGALPLAGAICRLSKQKNLAALLEAFAQVKHLYAGLWIIGDGEERQQLESLSGALGLSDQVKFWGFQHEPERFLAQIDVLCHVPIWEGFGLSVVEGMVAGCALLASDVDGLSELVRNENGEVAIVVDPRSRDAIVHGLERLGRDAVLRVQLAARGKERAERFTMDVMARNYEVLYRKLTVAQAGGVQ